MQDQKGRVLYFSGVAYEVPTNSIGKNWLSVVGIIRVPIYVADGPITPCPKSGMYLREQNILALMIDTVEIEALRTLLLKKARSRIGRCIRLLNNKKE